MLKVPRLGPRAFEQSAGFLRIHGAKDPLDASAVHPEAYPLVRRMSEESGLSVDSLIGNTRVLSTLRPQQFADEQFGVPTVTDVLAELDKPGRDPRPTFKTATFTEGVEKVSDLTPGMIVEGTVTNVAAFGAFVDVGVHQDGLVHVSEMSTSFVKDPHEVVSSGQVVKVRVVDVDVQRNRIGLSLVLAADANSERSRSRAGAQQGAGQGGKKQGGRKQSGKKPGGNNPGGRGNGKSSQQRGSARPTVGGGSMADALRKAGFGK